MSTDTTGSDPALEARVPPTERRVVERIPSLRTGDTVIRVRRPQFEGFSRTPEGHLEAHLELERPRGPIASVWRLLVGTPIHNELEAQERLSKRKALAVFSSDALSSVAYAPQETLVVLLAAGVTAMVWSIPIALAVVALLAIVVTSYRQTIYAYPSGGGSYIVARENLGELPGLVAAAALMVGYILTVSVSVASAVDQLISAVPWLTSARVGLAVGAVALVTLANLRGVRESGSIFAIPTYIFLACMYSMIGLGLVLLARGELVVPPPAHLPEPIESLSLFLILRAFAVGSAVMTGTEAISNGIPAFKSPEPRNAAGTLLAMAVILGIMFLGLSGLIVGAGVIPDADHTVLSKIASAVFGEGLLYYVVQGSAVLILVLAANTAYADFPRLASLLARDGYAPRQLQLRGERLAFSNGILLLGVLSALLIVLFGGSTGALLPLYALSVFTAFTMSQAGMVRHWRKVAGRNWRFKATVNGVGATVTGLVTLIVGITNLVNPELPVVPGLPLYWGSWMVLVITPCFVWLFLKVRRHYEETENATALPSAPDLDGPLKHLVVVPVARLNRPTIRALQYAASLSPHVMAVHIATDPEKADELEATWKPWSIGVPLVVIDSPYRSLTAPLLHFLGEVKKVEQADMVTVVLPEFVPDSLWEYFLHGQSAQFLKLALLSRPGFVVTSVPSHEMPRASERSRRARTNASSLQP